MRNCTNVGEELSTAALVIGFFLSFSHQRRHFVRAHYLEGADITGKMRAILVDWLCQVHHRFHLLQETLYLTVAIIDRYLQVCSTPLDVTCCCELDTGERPSSTAGSSNQNAPIPRIAGQC